MAVKSFIKVNPKTDERYGAEVEKETEYENVYDNNTPSLIENQFYYYKGKIRKWKNNIFNDFTNATKIENITLFPMWYHGLNLEDLDPIGGGPGYSKIITQEDADYIVTNKTELISALNIANPGDIIFMPSDTVIDNTRQPLAVFEGITLASDRGFNGSQGAEIKYTTDPVGESDFYRRVRNIQYEDRGDGIVRVYSDNWGFSQVGKIMMIAGCAEYRNCEGYEITAINSNQKWAEIRAPYNGDPEIKGVNYVALVECLLAVGPNVRMTGFRMHGPIYGRLDRDYDRYKLNTGVLVCDREFEMDNCEMSGWNKFGIISRDSFRLHIHHNYIHHTQREGFGYGVWMYGLATPTPVPFLREDYAVIDYNYMHDCRHEIASSNAKNSAWIARYNMMTEHGHDEQFFDRHTLGYFFEVKYNIVVSENNHVTDGWEQLPLLTNEISNNYFKHNPSDALPNDLDAFAVNHPDKFIYKDNSFGNAWAVNQPVIDSFTVDVQEGESPVTANITINATDPNDIPIDCIYMAENEQRDVTFSDKLSFPMTFTGNGVYTVELRCRNSVGIVSQPKFFKVHVRPDSTPAIKRGLNEWFDGNLESDDTILGKEAGMVLRNTSRTGHVLVSEPGLRGLDVLKWDDTIQFEELTVLDDISHATLMLPLDHDITWAFWIKPEDKFQSDRIFTMGSNNVTLSGIIFNYASHSGWIETELTGYLPPLRIRTPNNVIIPNQWNLCIFEYNIYNGGTWWVNGQTVKPNNPLFKTTTPIVSRIQRFRINRTINDHKYSGLIQSLATWHRWLTPEEKTWLWNDGNGRIYSDLG